MNDAVLLAAALGGVLQFLLQAAFTIIWWTILLLLVSLALNVVATLVLFPGLWRIFAKAGQPGWAAVVPIYNVLVVLRIVGKPSWWLILLCIPVVRLVLLLQLAADLTKSFGKHPAFTMAVFLAPLVGLPILGFGRAK